MAEELRIVVTDQTGSAGSGGTAPGTGSAGPSPGGTSPAAPRAGSSGSAEKKREAQFNANLAAVQNTERIASQAASGAAGGAIASAAGLAASALSNPVGIAIASVVAGFGVAAVAARTFARSVERETNRLAGFSGDLALAQAQTEIGRELGDLRRARRIGPDLAQAERTRARFEGLTSDIWTEILAQVLRIVNILEPISEFFLNRLEAFLLFLEERTEFLINLLNAVAPPSGTALSLILKALLRWEQERNQTDETDSFTQQFFDLLPRRENDAGDSVPLFWPNGQPVPPAV
jgi:hypothetical protein